MTAPVFALVDLQSFVCELRGVFRPSLAGPRSSSFHTTMNALLRASNEAKALGFVMGDPYHLNRAKSAATQGLRLKLKLSL